MVSNALPQTQCPYCQAPVNYFAPGCFNCRQNIQWPAPANEQQYAVQQAAIAHFQQAYAALMQQQAQQPQQPPAPQPVQQPPAPPQPAARMPGGDLDGLLEGTRHGDVAYDAQAAEDVEGLMPSSFADFVPRAMAVEAMPDLAPTTAAVEGPGLGITAPPAADFEWTRQADAGEVGAAALPEFESARFADAGVPVDGNGGIEMERTAVDDGRVARRAKRAAAAQEGSRICSDCGIVSGRLRCPACGAGTREHAA